MIQLHFKLSAIRIAATASDLLTLKFFTCLTKIQILITLDQSINYSGSPALKKRRSADEKFAWLRQAMELVSEIK